MANKAFNKNKSNLSFTLIELLVVIAIIGILAGIAIPAFQGATERAQIAKGLQFSDSLRNSLMINLISEWKFDDYLTNPSSTTAKDSWAKYNANTGNLVGFNFNDPNSGWRTGSNCVSGSCLSFDGIDDYVNCGNGASLNITDAITIEAWIKPNTVSGLEKGIVSKRDKNVCTNYYLFQSSDKLQYGYCGLDSAWHNYFSNKGLTRDWQHVAVTFLPLQNKIYFYRNGTNFGVVNTTSSPASYPNLPLVIGWDAGYTYFSGLIDEVRIYNAALPQAMIQQHYVQGLNSMLANTISYEEYSQRMSEISSNFAIK